MVHRSTKVGDDYFVGYINILNKKQGRVLYDITKIRRVENGDLVQEMNPVAVSNSSYEEMLKHYKKDVKRKSVDVDSAGRDLTSGQQSYFKDSKLVDETGALKVMYHGTKRAGFSYFDPDYSEDELSLFFTDNIGVAASYNGGTKEILALDKEYSFDELKNMIESYSYGDITLEVEDGKYIFDDHAWVRKEFENLNDARDLFFDNYFGASVGDDVSAVYAIYLDVKNPLNDPPKWCIVQLWFR